MSDSGMTYRWGYIDGDERWNPLRSLPPVRSLDELEAQRDQAQVLAVSFGSSKPVSAQVEDGDPWATVNAGDL